MRRVPPLMLACLSLMVGTAHADPGRPLDESLSRFRAGIRIAEQVFPNTLCEPVAYRYVPRQASPLVGTFDSGKCQVTVYGRHSFGMLCSILVHERGHAAGRGHHLNPRSIMHQKINRPHPLCGGYWRRIP